MSKPKGYWSGLELSKEEHKFLLEILRRIPSEESVVLQDNQEPKRSWILTAYSVGQVEVK